MDSPPVTGSQVWTGLEFAEHSAGGWTSTLGPVRVEFTGMAQFYDSQGRAGSEECTPGQCVVGDHYVKRIHVHLPDGSRYLFPAYAGGADLTATHLADRHGNSLAYNAAARQWTDTLGRVLTDPLPEHPAAGTTTEFRAELVGGAAEAVYTFHWKNLDDVLTPDPATGQPPPLKYPGGYKCGPNSYQAVSPSLFTSSGGTRVCVERDANDNPKPHNPVVLEKIDLPVAGLPYRFSYTIYGEIDRVYLPTGGAESFTYGGAPSLSRLDPPYSQANRGVIERRAGAGGGAPESVWEYEVRSTTPYGTRVTSAADGAYTERLLHRSRYSGTGESIARFGFDDARIGMAYEERAFSAAGVMLRRSLSKWAEDGPAAPGHPGAARGPKVTKAVSIILDGEGANALWSAAVTRYEQAGRPLNATSVTEYGYDTLMTKAAARTAGIDSFNTSDTLAVRTTETVYLADPSYDARNMTALPATVTLRGGLPVTGAVVARAETRYDRARVRAARVRGDGRVV